MNAEELKQEFIRKYGPAKPPDRFKFNKELNELLQLYADEVSRETKQNLLTELKNHTDWSEVWWASMKIDEFIKQQEDKS